MNTDTRNRTLALAGLFQSVMLVQQTAYGKPRDRESTATSIGSIFNTDPASVVDVYGSIEAIRPGLEILVQQLGKNSKYRNMELTRYLVTLIHVENKLNKNQMMLETIRSKIETCKQQITSEDAIETSIIANLADIYKQTISTLQPRVMVNGEPTVLTNSDSKNMVRALLLAGIRSAVLLRQSGGTRFKLILQRKRLFECAREQLQAMCQTD